MCHLDGSRANAGGPLVTEETNPSLSLHHAKASVRGADQQGQLRSQAVGTWWLAAHCPGPWLSPHRYHLTVIALIYFLPLVVMFVAYSIIGLTLWKRAVPRHEAHGANLRHLRAKKKVSSWGRASLGSLPCSPKDVGAIVGKQPGNPVAGSGAPQRLGLGTGQCSSTLQDLLGWMGFRE